MPLDDSTKYQAAAASWEPVAGASVPGVVEVGRQAVIDTVEWVATFPIDDICAAAKCSKGQARELKEFARNMRLITIIARRRVVRS